jgi:malonyl CoA-acyl carrier protein transacylase
MTTYVFPGQGSQVKGMGNALFDAFPEYVAKADAILGYSIKTLCLEDQDQLLNQTEYTQPALFVVNALSYLNKIKEKPQELQFLAGHSLGEYNALLAANVFDFETGLKLVKKRGELMSQATGGAMAAVIGLKAEDIVQLLAEHQLENISIANFNTYTQIVITGPKMDIEKAETHFKQGGAKLFVPLKVSGAFHSNYMQEAQDAFEKYLSQFNLANPTIPVIANINAKPYQTHEVASTLSKQITHSVQWTRTIEFLLQNNEENIEEIGPGSVLTGLIKRIKNNQ